MRVVERAVVLALLIGLALSGPAEARRKKKRRIVPRPKPVDVSKVVDHLDVWHDGKGHYFALFWRKVGDRRVKRPSKWIFYSAGGRVFYRQYSSSSGANKNDFHYLIHDPRVLHRSRSGFEVKDGKGTFKCEKRKTALTMMAPDKAAALLKKAKFRDIYWVRQAHVLARDDDGIYYYVDRLADEEYVSGRKRGFRVFVGPMGQMKQLRMRNMVSDPMGEIFITTDGRLKLVTEKGRVGTEAVWVTRRGKKKKKKKKVQLTTIPLRTWKTGTLIYRDLGVYAGVKLHKPCDDL
jgi:hypothetical protein